MKSALPARLAGPVSGYDAESAREPAAARLYRRRFAVPRAMHAVERTRRLLAAAVGYPVPETTGRFRHCRRTARPTPALGLPPRYAMVMHAASWPTKLWPEEHWRALLPVIAVGGRGIVLPWGNAEEKARAERLAAGIPGAMVLPRVMAGAELARVIAGAEFAVGLDSGLMHLAAALDVPGVWLYGPTDPGLTGPYGEGQIVIQSTWPKAPCRRRTCDDTPGGDCCMRAIGVERGGGGGTDSDEAVAQKPLSSRAQRACNGALLTRDPEKHQAPGSALGPRLALATLARPGRQSVSANVRFTPSSIDTKSPS